MNSKSALGGGNGIHDILCSSRPKITTRVLIMGPLLGPEQQKLFHGFFPFSFRTPSFLFPRSCRNSRECVSRNLNDYLCLNSSGLNLSKEGSEMNCAPAFLQDFMRSNPVACVMPTTLNTDPRPAQQVLTPFTPWKSLWSTCKEKPQARHKTTEVHFRPSVPLFLAITKIIFTNNINL